MTARPALRNDAILIRRLAETYSPEFAESWQRLPHVILPGDGFTDHLLAEDTPGVRQICETMPCLDHLPWKDFILDLGDSFPVVVRRLRRDTEGTDNVFDHTPGFWNYYSDPQNRTWARVRPLQRLQKDPYSSIWLGLQAMCARMPAPNQPVERIVSATDLIDSLDGEKHVFVEVFREKFLRETTASQEPVRLPGGRKGLRIIRPEMFVIPVDDPWDQQRTITIHGYDPTHFSPCARCPDGDKAFCKNDTCPVAEGRNVFISQRTTSLLNARLVVGAIAHLLHGDGHMVRVRQDLPPERNHKNAKAAAKRPWIREGLPTYILIDPDRVADYRPAGGTTSGTHLSPRPHERRGHWRQLRAERYREKKLMWIKPAWIGDTEWTCEGQTYKVVPTHSRDKQPC